MPLRLYRTSLAAARFSSVLKFSRLGKMTERGMKSTIAVTSLNSSNSLTDNEPQLWDSTSQVAYEKVLPSISAAISSMPKSKRRTRLDLATHCENKLDHKTRTVDPLKLDESTSTSHQNEQNLPSSFGKKHLPSSRSPKIQRKHHNIGVAKKSLKFSPDTAMDEPFDICHLETEETKPDEQWVLEVEPTIENEKHKDNIVDSIEEIGQVLRPGMVLFKNYLSLSEQVEIVNTCRELGCGTGGFYRPGYDDGAKLRLYMMCLGLDWNPQTKTYAEKRHHDNVAPPQIPPEFITLVGRVLDDSHVVVKQNSKLVVPEDILPAMSPDVCIINFYTTNGRLGLHQDRDESQESRVKGLPVVSISIGDSAEFLYGDQRDAKKAEQILLESGDVLIFGGESRHIFHGVKNITPNTAPSALLDNTKLRPGRLNLTFRKN